MKISLNELVDLLADRTGHSFSIPIQEELKVIFNYKREDWIQKIIDKHPEQRKNFLKDFSVSLVEVDRAECPVDVDCTVLRTSLKIPQPIRSEYTLFDYVGAPDKSDGLTYTAPDQFVIMKKYGSKYTADRAKYFYVNGYVYIYGDLNITNLNIRGLWPDQRQLGPFKCSDVPCYTDDDQYDVPGDIINSMVQDVIKNELKLFVSPEKAEVTISNPNDQ